MLYLLLAPTDMDGISFVGEGTTLYLSMTITRTQFPVALCFRLQRVRLLRNCLMNRPTFSVQEHIHGHHSVTLHHARKMSIVVIGYVPNL